MARRGRPKGSKNKSTKNTKKIIRKAAITKPEVEFVEEDGEVRVKAKSKEEEPKKYQKNIQVATDLLRCPKCGKSNTQILKTTAYPQRTMMLEGELIRGIRVQRRACMDCPQRFIVKLPLE